jgi:hypothetical protein
MADLMADQPLGTTVTYTSKPLFAEMESLLPPQRVTVTKPAPRPKVEKDGRTRRDEGMAAVWSRTPEAWRRMAIDVLYQLCRQRQTLTADVLWEALPVKPPGHHSVIGVLWQEAIRRGMVKRTGLTVKTTRPVAKARDIPVYQSLLYKTTD